MFDSPRQVVPRLYPSIIVTARELYRLSEQTNYQSRACKLLIWCWRWGSKEVSPLKRRKFLIPMKARNAKSAISANPWHVYGTRTVPPFHMWPANHASHVQLGNLPSDWKYRTYASKALNPDHLEPWKINYMRFAGGLTQ
jgi:hypothetical protein